MAQGFLPISGTSGSSSLNAAALSKGDLSTPLPKDSLKEGWLAPEKEGNEKEREAETGRFANLSSSFRDLPSLVLYL